MTPLADSALKVAVVVLLSLVALLPAAPAQAPASPLAQARHAFSPAVLRVLGIALLMFAGEYAAFTYISPFLQQVAGVSAPGIGSFVLAFGVASAIGSYASR